MPAADPLVQAVEAECGALIAARGLRQTTEVVHYGATVTLESDRWELEMFYGGREFDFLAGIRFREFRRKNPVPLWAVLEALGVESTELQSLMPDAKGDVREQVACLAGLLDRHWDLLDRPATPELFKEVSRVLDRHDRRLRAQR